VQRWLHLLRYRECKAARCPWTDAGCENGPPPVDGGS
jgi:hypothetical protein